MLGGLQLLIGAQHCAIYFQKILDVHVWVDETRPRNQGASLTSYELNNEGVENTIITDNTAGLLMQRGQMNLCIVGADRVTNKGHVANKIGTVEGSNGLKNLIFLFM